MPADSRDEGCWEAYDAEVQNVCRRFPEGSGGDFYLTLSARVSKRFARALVISTLEGRSSFTEAFRLLGFKKMATFRELGAKPGSGLLMAYLLDANVFIQAKNLHYGFDFCPAFWDWLVVSNAAGLGLQHREGRRRN